MSKRNMQQNSDGSNDVAAPVMQAGAATMDQDTETSGRDNSFTQAEDVDDDAGADAPPDAVETIDPVDVEKAAKRAAFREYCIQYPDMIHNFPLSDIIADPKRNVRFVERTAKDAAVIDLAAAIKSAGRQIVPGEVLLGLDNNLYVSDGAGRYLALTLINATRQPSDQLPFRAVVVIERADAPMQPLIDQAQINWHREGLTVLDRAKIVGELQAAGIRQVDISKRLGIKPAMTSVLARVAKFSDQVKQWIVEDKISAVAAYDLAVEDPEKVEAAAKKLIDGAGGKRVTKAAVNTAINKTKATAAGKGEAGAKPKKSKGRQRTAKQILSFIEDEATDATNKKFGDKNLAKKLECIAAFVGGQGGDTFLKNLAAL